MKLRNIIVLTKDVSKAVVFYTEAIGLKVIHQTPEQAELDTGGTPLVLKECFDVPKLTSGYTPIITFDIKNMDLCITNAISAGAMLDGPIKYATQGKVGKYNKSRGAQCNYDFVLLVCIVTLAGWCNCRSL